MDGKFRSRKWILCVFIQATVTLFIVTSLIDGDVYGKITMANVTSYSFANAAIYLAERNKADA